MRIKSRHLQGAQSARARRAQRNNWLAASGLACGVALGILAPLPGLAQPAAPPAAAAAADAVETVVVTARKRVERLQDVPLSITAITADTIVNAGLRNLQDVANLTAGLTISAAGAEAYLSPTIRGLTNLNGGSGDPNVALFLDGIYLSNNSAISLGLISIERVEVVKGPVSALYGRNAFAGAINYVTKKAPPKFGGDVELGLTSASGQTLKATVGGPINPGVLSATASLGIDKSGGTWKDPVSGQRGGGYDKKDGMVSASLTPTRELTIDASIYYGDDTFDVVPLAIAANNCGSKTSATAAVNANAFRQFCGRFEYATPIQVPSYKASAGVVGNSRTVNSDRLRASYDFSLFDASAMLGHNDVKQTRYNDFTGLRDGIPYALANAATPGTPNGRIQLANELFGNVLNNKDDQFEVRIASKPDRPLRWSLGYNYFKASFDSFTVLGVDTSALPAGMVLANVIGLPVQALWGTADGSISGGRGYTSGTDKVSSPFGSIDYDITPALTASAEARHTTQDKTQTIFSTTSSLVAPVNTAGNGTNTSAKSFGFNNYRAALRFKLSEDQMFYASVANGTKSGGFNARATAAEDVSFNPETNRTLEAGTKVSLFNRKLQLGFALFHVDTQDIQISGPAAAANNPGLVTKNFGGTKSEGFELDIAAVPVPGLRINAGIGYANSRFKSDSFDFGVSRGTAAVPSDCDLIPGCAARLVSFVTPAGTTRTALSLDGLRVPRTSKVTATLGVQYNGTINTDWGWFARSDYRYESSRMIQNANWAYIPSRKLVNLRIGLESEKYRFTAFVNNVTDDATPEGVAQNIRLNDFTGPYAGALPARRSYGVTAGVTF